MQTFRTAVKFLGIFILSGISAYLPSNIPVFIRETEWNLNVNFGPGQWANDCQYTPHYLTNNGALFGTVNTMAIYIRQRIFWLSSSNGLVQLSRSNTVPFRKYFADRGLFFSIRGLGPLYAAAVNIRLTSSSASTVMKVNDDLAFQSPSPLYGENFAPYPTVTNDHDGYIVIGAALDRSCKIVTLTYLKNLIFGSLAGNITLITGSSRGMGRATAIHVSSLGSAVLVNYLDREEKDTEVVIRLQGTFKNLLNISDTYFSGNIQSLIQDILISTIAEAAKFAVRARKSRSLSSIWHGQGVGAKLDA